MFFVALVLVAAAWELYKAVGPEQGGSALGWRILPRTSDNAMPHVWDMFSRYGRAETRASSREIWRVVLAGAWFSMRLALLGFVLGVGVGLGLAIVMARFRVAERGLLPYLVVSQTVPLIALAPLVASWGGKLRIGDHVWLVTFPTWRPSSSRSPLRSSRLRRRAERSAFGRPRRRRTTSTSGSSSTAWAFRYL